jgi:hypothetical protein
MCQATRRSRRSGIATAPRAMAGAGRCPAPATVSLQRLVVEWQRPVPGLVPVVVPLEDAEAGDGDGLGDLAGGDELADLVVLAGSEQGVQFVEGDGVARLSEGTLDSGAVGVAQRLVVGGGCGWWSSGLPPCPVASRRFLAQARRLPRPGGKERGAPVLFGVRGPERRCAPCARSAGCGRLTRTQPDRPET